MFHYHRVEYSDGMIDLVPIHTSPPAAELGFGHEQVWRITLHNKRNEIGQISYRDGESRYIYYYGHIGYHIDASYRGNHYAYAACRLIEKEILLSGKSSVVITCDPDNEPSRRTCLRLGCMFERIAEVPDYIYRKYEINRTKCRYIWRITPADEK